MGYDAALLCNFIVGFLFAQKKIVANFISQHMEIMLIFNLEGFHNQACIKLDSQLYLIWVAWMEHNFDVEGTFADQLFSKKMNIEGKVIEDNFNRKNVY